jgi:RHS repeat-associated protein
MVAEYSTVTASQSEAKISYLTNDHLGSPRITTDTTGKIVSRRDFMPFGEEIPRANYGNDSVRQKFTGYERDSEIEEDYAQARYYNYKIGRFNSVDPLMASADIINPQTLNRYAYVGNNPTNITDPTGEQWGVNGNTIQWFDGALGAGFTAYNLLYGVIQGTNQMVALNPNGGYVEVASAAAWLTQEVAWGGTAATLSAGAAALAGVPIAVAALALAEILDPAGRWRTGMNTPEPVREFAGTKQSYWNEFTAAMSKGKESTASSGNTQSQTPDTAKPNPEDNMPDTSANSGGGKDGRKSNPDKVASAKQREQDARAELTEIKSRPNKTKQDFIERDIAQKKLNKAISDQKKSESHGRGKKGS